VTRARTESAVVGTAVRDAAAPSRAFLVVACVASVAFAAISFTPDLPVPKYRLAWLFLVPILWGAFLFRRAVGLAFADFVAFAVALLLHDLGAFRGYSWSLGGLQYDWCVHAFFGWVGGRIAVRAIALRTGARGRGLVLLAVLAVGGVSAVHEVTEAASTMFFGDYGMLYVGADNPYDTQEDMLAGLIGAAAGAIAARWALERERG
jgi:hypothetical protein